MTEPRTVIHVAPHPDDEALGAPATLLGLAEAGWRVINVAASVGRRAHAPRRRIELEESCRRLGFELVVLDPPASISSTDDLAAARTYIAGALAEIAAGRSASLLVGPSPHDGHHGHVVVGQALGDVAKASGTPWWMWGLWADLPKPTLYVPFTDEALGRAVHGLEAHVSELERNDYRPLIGARATANAVLGSERVFGFGSQTVGAEPYAELLTECVFDGERWAVGNPRVLDVASDAEPQYVYNERFATWIESGYLPL